MRSSRHRTCCPKPRDRDARPSDCASCNAVEAVRVIAIEAQPSYVNGQDIARLGAHDIEGAGLGIAVSRLHRALLVHAAGIDRARRHNVPGLDDHDRRQVGGEDWQYAARGHKRLSMDVYSSEDRTAEQEALERMWAEDEAEAAAPEPTGASARHEADKE